jgi:hypothetical protein
VALLGCGGSPKGQVDLARALTGRLRRAHDAMAAGALSVDGARVLADETAKLDAACVAEVLERALPAAGRGTVSEFRRTVRRAVLRADPLRAEDAAERAAQARHVSRRADADGQATLFVNGPAIDIATVFAALDVHATSAAAMSTVDGSPVRTLDQRRFDALTDICSRYLDTVDRVDAATPTAAHAATRTRRGVRPGVFIFADAATWAGLVDGPVELAGYGPIPAGVARAHFTDSRWHAVVTDALTGVVRSVSDASYSPSARTRRHLFVGTGTADSPGASRPCGTATPTTTSRMTSAGPPARTTADCCADAITD